MITCKNKYSYKKLFVMELDKRTLQEQLLNDLINLNY